MTIMQKIIALCDCVIIVTDLNECSKHVTEGQESVGGSVGKSYLHKHQPSHSLQQQSSSHRHDVNSRIILNVRVESHAVARLRFIRQD